MSLSNCTILRVDAPGEPTPFGEETFVEGPSTAVRATFEGAIAQAKRDLGATLQDATALFRVRTALAPWAATLAAQSRLLVRLDGEPAGRLWQVVYVRPRPKSGGLGHVEAFGREVASS